MNSNSYVLLILGIVFVFIGIWFWKKDREQFKILENRLSEKEKYIYELYESLEQLMKDMDSLYGQSHPDEIIPEDFQFDNKQEYDEVNEYKIEEDDDDIYNNIIRLKNEGASEEDIAKRLGMGKGEIKLILELKHDRSR